MDSSDDYIQTKEFQSDYFELLKKYKTSEVKLVNFYPTNRNSTFVTFKIYDILSFKIMLCEIIYNAINLFPDIYEYTISCIGTHQSTITIGFLNDLDDNGEPAIMKIKNHHGTHIINKEEVFQLYRYNRDPDIEMTNTISLIMRLGGNIPIIKTSYKSKSSNKGFIEGRVDFIKKYLEIID